PMDGEHSVPLLCEGHHGAPLVYFGTAARQHPLAFELLDHTSGGRGRHPHHMGHGTDVRAVQPTHRLHEQGLCECEIFRTTMPMSSPRAGVDRRVDQFCPGALKLFELGTWLLGAGRACLVGHEMVLAC